MGAQRRDAEVACQLRFARTFVVFAEDVLNRIEVVLAHITQSTTVVVPVTAECAVHTMRSDKACTGPGRATCRNPDFSEPAAW